MRFFSIVPPTDFLFGTFWGPDTMVSADATDPSRYGAVPLFWGTIFIGAIIAMAVAIPLGLMSAIYLTQYADPRVRQFLDGIADGPVPFRYPAGDYHIDLL